MSACLVHALKTGLPTGGSAIVPVPNVGVTSDRFPLSESIARWRGQGPGSGYEGTASAVAAR